MALTPEEFTKIQTNLEERRVMLLDQRETVIKRREELRAEQAEPEEMGRNQDERRALTAMQDRVDDELVLVNEALQRITTNDFGFCQQCGKEISLERLRAKPWARYCLEHAEAEASEPGIPTGEMTNIAPSPEEFAGLNDDAKARLVWEKLRYDGRVPMDSLDVDFVDGRLRLSGMIPGADGHEAMVNVVHELLGFEDYVDETRVERPATPPRSARREFPDKKTGKEEVFQGEGIETDPDIAEEEGEVLDPPKTMRRE